VLISPEEYEHLRKFEAYINIVRLSETLRLGGASASELYQASRNELEGRQ